MKKVYGKEVVEYRLDTKDDYDSIKEDTLDWSFNDKHLNGSDATIIKNGTSIDDNQDIFYKSSGVKETSTTVNFDDGWGNIYKKKSIINIEAVQYEPPVVDFSFSPENPTINDEVIFTQNVNDVRDDSIPKYYGEILSTRIDFEKDGIIDKIETSKDYKFKHIYSEKKDDLQVLMRFIYSDGWEDKSIDIIKEIEMKNILPICSYSNEKEYACIPVYSWEATSVDPDGDDESLEYEWVLYFIYEDNSREIINKSHKKTFAYVFQKEGKYKISLKTIDPYAGSDLKEDEFNVNFKECVESQSEVADNNISIPSDNTTVINNDCKEAIALAIENYKRESLPDKNNIDKKLIIVSDRLESNVVNYNINKEPSAKIHIDSMSGRINNTMSGKIKSSKKIISTNSSKIGGNINGKIK